MTLGSKSWVWLVLAVMLASTLASTSSALANGNITFSAGEGAAAPPKTLGPYTMTPFAADPTADGTLVTSIPSPIGTLSLGKALTKATVPATWGSWSNGYTSNVYFSNSEESVTLLPSGIAAVYFYIEPDGGGSINFTVTAEDGQLADTTSSPAIAPSSAGEARYFGFYAIGGQTISKITVVGATPSDGVGLGEFGMAAPLPPTATTGSATSITATGAQLGGTINPDYSPTTSFFEYGTTTSYGQGTPSPSAHDGNGSEAVTASAGLVGLQPGTTYHYRLVAVNSLGMTVDGADATFTTGSVPALAPAPVPAPAVPTPAVKQCVVPRLSHLSLSAVKSALDQAGCALGKVKQQKRPKSTKGLSFGVLVESPAAGTSVALATKVNVTLGWFKRPKPHKHS